MSMSRRDFLSRTSLIGATFFIPKSFNAFAKTFDSSLMDMSPISLMSSFSASTDIAGDTPDEAHEIFWNKEGFISKKGGLPKTNEHYDVIIIGGGLSALSAAYHLAGENKKVLILEGNPRLGGNAKAERFNNTYLSQGSAYTTIPEEGGMIESFYKDIGIFDRFRRTKAGEDSIAVHGKIYQEFWQGSTDLKNKDAFVSVHDRLNDIYNNSYPELPLIPGMDIDRSALNSLDSIKFQDWVKKEIPGVHPHIDEYFHQYCWSSFGCSYEEISAAQALNFITSDLQGIQALPGGNALIAEGIINKIKNGKIAFKSSTFCVDVREDGNDVYVCYYEDNKKLMAAKGTKCIVTSPKLVAKHIVEGLAKDQHDAMNDMRYHAYLVANVILKRNVKAPAYDLYSLIEKIPTNEYEDSKKRVFSDMTFANWANENESSHQALTLYIPLPYDMAQQFLFSPMLYEKYDGRVKKAIDPFLQTMGIAWSDVDGIRLTRYGHALPVAVSGGISSGLFERAHAPINNKIFFANQDNWGNPCFETCYAVGSVAAYQAMGKEMDI